MPDNSAYDNPRFRVRFVLWTAAIFYLLGRSHEAKSIELAQRRAFVRGFGRGLADSRRVYRNG